MSQLERIQPDHQYQMICYKPKEHDSIRQTNQVIAFDNPPRNYCTICIGDMTMGAKK